MRDGSKGWDGVAYVEEASCSVKVALEVHSGCSLDNRHTEGRGNMMEEDIDDNLACFLSLHGLLCLIFEHTDQ